MEDATYSSRNMNSVEPFDMRDDFDLPFRISTRIAELMTARNLTRKQFADAIGKRPCEVTKWLSGEHNFTISTLAMISAFFGQPIISVV